MENLIVRKAGIDELDVLFEFEQGIVRTERPFDVTLKEGEIHYYDLARLILSPDAEVLVATLGDEIVGSGFAEIRGAENYLKHERFAHLGFMYVKPEQRGRGVNQRILEALKKWAVARDVTELRLEVYNANAAAIKAYEKVGFTAHILKMRMAATEDS
jgi:ribosomal protein S18 acetylase RimI-like enzyme